MASRVINMTIPHDLLKAADAAARAEGKTRSQLFREAVELYVAERRSAGKKSSSILSRLAALAVEGPRLSARELDRLLYASSSRR